MTTRERIIGNRIYLEIVIDESEEASEQQESPSPVVVIDLVPDLYGEL
ncbi:MAG: hypothetical protein HY303_07745 [Candidatus Wallbacteria bacterium]|nr:hypothetical protein [Candidatus Wallbacteria bacterium]